MSYFKTIEQTSNSNNSNLYRFGTLIGPLCIFGYQYIKNFKSKKFSKKRKFNDEMKNSLNSIKNKEILFCNPLTFSILSKDLILSEVIKEAPIYLQTNLENNSSTIHDEIEIFLCKKSEDKKNSENNLET